MSDLEVFVACAFLRDDGAEVERGVSGEEERCVDGSGRRRGGTADTMRGDLVVTVGEDETTSVFESVSQSQGQKGEA